MPSFSGKKNQTDRIRTERGVTSQEIWNSKGKFEIPALLKCGTICLVSMERNSE